ncbi:unnamed protein product [Caenorhabditis angaria]|uniref:Uncharacterized protein n=1 Tax=Caenorhabditis angaria TaxID=860376 RepID=A0A9P1I4S2_9PELO|nr:unnamed protein product [Caenorhabditis angaria]
MYDRMFRIILLFFFIHSTFGDDSKTSEAFDYAVNTTIDYIEALRQNLYLSKVFDDKFNLTQNCNSESFTRDQMLKFRNGYTNPAPIKPYILQKTELKHCTLKWELISTDFTMFITAKRDDDEETFRIRSQQITYASCEKFLNGTREMDLTPLIDQEAYETAMQIFDKFRNISNFEKILDEDFHLYRKDNKIFSKHQFIKLHDTYREQILKNEPKFHVHNVRKNDITDNILFEIQLHGDTIEVNSKTRKIIKITNSWNSGSLSSCFIPEKEIGQKIANDLMTKYLEAVRDNNLTLFQTVTSDTFEAFDMAIQSFHMLRDTFFKVVLGNLNSAKDISMDSLYVYHFDIFTGDIYFTVLTAHGNSDFHTKREYGKFLLSSERMNDWDREKVIFDLKREIYQAGIINDLQNVIIQYVDAINNRNIHEFESVTYPGFMIDKQKFKCFNDSYPSVFPELTVTELIIKDNHIEFKTTGEGQTKHVYDVKRLRGAYYLTKEKRKENWKNTYTTFANLLY